MSDEDLPPGLGQVGTGFTDPSGSEADEMPGAEKTPSPPVAQKSKKAHNSATGRKGSPPEPAGSFFSI